MKRVWIAIIFGALLVPVALTGQDVTEKTAEALGTLVMPGDPKIVVEFELVRKLERCDVEVKITNRSDTAITVEHPGNRYALAFLVMNELGNVVEPVGLAKVNRAKHEAIVLKPGETFTHTVVSSVRPRCLFQFLSGSALFGYELEFGKTYRVVAVYRPEGKDGEGVCSAEKVIEFEAHLHEVGTE